MRRHDERGRHGHELANRAGLAAMLSAAALLTGCMYQPCDRYVDYLCTCHEDDPEYDCETMQNAYADASADMQDQCSIELSDQQAEDDEAGLECDF